MEKQKLNLRVSNSKFNLIFYEVELVAWKKNFYKYFRVEEWHHFVYLGFATQFRNSRIPNTHFYHLIDQSRKIYINVGMSKIYCLTSRIDILLGYPQFYLKSAMSQGQLNEITQKAIIPWCELTSWKSSHRRCSIKKGVLKNFTKFTGKHSGTGIFLWVL